MADDPFLSGSSDEGRFFLGLSLTSPDQVICSDSPDLPRMNPRGDSPVNACSVELSLENCVNGSDVEALNKQLYVDSSFELLPQLAKEGFEKDLGVGVSINVGSNDGSIILDGVSFSEDRGFVGGETVRTSAAIGNGQGEGLCLYQTARVGEFLYCFPSLQPGEYVVCLHFAEIIFIEGPGGRRVFNVFIQDKKVVSGLDIFAQVGANKPLVVADLKAFVNGEEGLLIRFEGVSGIPIVCGISISKDSPTRNGEAQLLKSVGMPRVAEQGSTKKKKKKRVRWQDNEEYEFSGDYQRLLDCYEQQKKELMDMRMALEELERDNHLKSRECEDAWKSMRELQNELIRKSMHVGSLAFAIEGQVKEKSRWFTNLRDVTRKLKIMKMEHIKLSEEASAYNKCISEIIEMRSTIETKMKQQVDLFEDLKIKYIKAAKEEKDLYNKVLELKGNIRVFCRCRPQNAEEIAAGTSVAINFDSAKDSELTVTSNGLPRKSFKFDVVFGPQANQAHVFEEISPFATSVLDGYNVCIFAYGQTGTGKTFTMEGSEGARGVNFRTLAEVFNIINERCHQFRYEVSVSVLEIYNEQIRDLLHSSHQGIGGKRLEVRQVGEGIHHVPGLVEAHVSNMVEAWEVLQTGSHARAVGSTNANEHSSRSHCIHCVMVRGENLLTGECTKSKLWLVDLAGSERVSKTEVQGERLKETQNINRSLSALGDVIAALATKSHHIPFRNSKLTHLLQDYLGGESKTLMFVQISPNENDIGETLCSLNFASRARGIELGPAKRQLDSSDLLKYKVMTEKSKQDLKIKDVQIKKMEETIQGLDMKLKEKDLKNKNLQEKVKELESQLLVERKLARQHVDTRIAEQQQKQKDEENSAPRLPNRLVLASYKNINEPGYNALNQKEFTNFTQPMTENNSFKPAIAFPTADDLFSHIDTSEKENNPPDLHPLPKRTGRASMCPMVQRVPAPSVKRRNSLIPLPNMPVLPRLLSSPLPLAQCPVREDNEEGSDAGSMREQQTLCDSPKGIRSANKLNTVLRKSLQKKIQTKSPVQNYPRKGGINVGLERVRVSIVRRGSCWAMVEEQELKMLRREVGKKRREDGTLGQLQEPQSDCLVIV